MVRIHDACLRMYVGMNKNHIDVDSEVRLSVAVAKSGLSPSDHPSAGVYVYCGADHTQIKFDWTGERPHTS